MPIISVVAGDLGSHAWVQSQFRIIFIANISIHTNARRRIKHTVSEANAAPWAVFLANFILQLADFTGRLILKHIFFRLSNFKTFEYLKNEQFDYSRLSRI